MVRFSVRGANAESGKEFSVDYVGIHIGNSLQAWMLKQGGQKVKKKIKVRKNPKKSLFPIQKLQHQLLLG